MNPDTLSLFRESEDSYGNEYKMHLFEQYRLYVEMVDRVSARRMLANSFFVGVNTTLITAFTILLKEGIFHRSFISYVPFLAAILLCFVWWRIVFSYRQLNSGKFRVIHALEARLPAAPYDAEWEALGAGRNAKLYRPLTDVENWVPICFGLLYLILACILWSQI